MNQNTTQLNTEVNQAIFLDTNALLHINRLILDARARADAALIAATLTCSEPCDCCGTSAPTFKDSETQCAYCLICLEMSTEPMDDSGEVDEEIVAIGQRILAEQAASRSRN